MRHSQLLVPTVKETPAEAEVISHKLMLRAGMIRKVAAGIYTYLPIGLRVIQKVSQIVREEMNRAGAKEILMPAVVPAELWRESGRWDLYGKELLRLKDRHDRDFCFGPTHEEVVTDVVRKEVRSYRQLPVNLYQIQTKFRDERRPRFGLMRGREFIMKDAYSFHRDEADAEREYGVMVETYKRIFTRCGLTFRAVEADTGTIGGSFSHEFMVLAETGEDEIASCGSCDYAANVEKAESRHHGLPVGWAAAAASSPGQPSRETARPVEAVPTPGKKSVEEVAGTLGVDPRRLIKTLIVLADGEPVAVLIRGDHDLNEVKLGRVLGCQAVVMADAAVTERVTAAPVGFAGPVGLSGVRIVADRLVEGMVNAVAGGNAADTHFVNVNPGRDFTVSLYADLNRVRAGDRCPRCETGALRIDRGIEVGHVFKLGTKYSEAMGAAFLDEEGKGRPFVMGCYGIGVGRTAAAAVEQNNDADGIVWPLPLAPFSVLVLPLNVRHEATRMAAEEIYRGLLARGIDTLIDDRDERAGGKFKDADLIGIPFRVVIGEKGLAEGMVEIKERRTGTVHRVPRDEAIPRVVSMIQ